MLPQTEKPSEKNQRSTRIRGRARRKLIVSAARELLRTSDLAAISMQDISDHSQIPQSSLYYFFSNINEIYSAIADELAKELIEIGPVVPKDAGSWQELVAEFVQGAAHYFNGHKDAQQLLLGPRAIPEIRHAACMEDYRFGRQLHGLLDRQFHLPAMADPVGVCFRAIELCDTIFSLSVSEHGRVTAEMEAESLIVVEAYLGCYLPRVLLKKPCEVSHQQC